MRLKIRFRFSYTSANCSNLHCICPDDWSKKSQAREEPEAQENMKHDPNNKKCDKNIEGACGIEHCIPDTHACTCPQPTERELPKYQKCSHGVAPLNCSEHRQGAIDECKEIIREYNATSKPEGSGDIEVQFDPNQKTSEYWIKDFERAFLGGEKLDTTSPMYLWIKKWKNEWESKAREEGANIEANIQFDLGRSQGRLERTNEVVKKIKDERSIHGHFCGNEECHALEMVSRLLTDLSAKLKETN